jgi:hypothetical protein
MDAAPAISINPAPLAYFEKQGPATIDRNLTVSAEANAQLEAATVRLIGYESGEDVLGVDAPNGLATWWDPSRGVLALTGAAPASTYQAALRSITYADLSANPSTSPRIAEFLVTDRQLISQAADRGISIVATNDPPSVLAPPGQTLVAGATLTFGAAGGNSIVVSDVDANGAAEQVTLAATHGRFTLAASQGLSFTVGTGAGDLTMTFTGTLDRVNAALDGLTFAPEANYAGSASVLVSVDDLGNTGLGGPQIVNARVPITVTGNPAPNTPADQGAQIGAGAPTTPPPTPPIVGQPPPGGTSVPPPPEPLTGKVPLPVTLAAPPDTGSTIPSDAPMPPLVEASEASGRDVLETSGGATSAESGSGGSDVVASSRQIQAVFYTPRSARRPPAVTSSAIQWPAEPGWARQVVLASWRIESSWPRDRLNAEPLQAAGFFAFARNGATRAMRAHPHVSFVALNTDQNREADAMAGAAGLWRDLDVLHRRVTSDIPVRVWAGTASVLTVGASVAWFLWMSRAGSLLSGLMSAVPAWSVVDPLPVLEHLGQTGAMLKRNADDGIEKLLRNGAGS